MAYISNRVEFPVTVVKRGGALVVYFSLKQVAALKVLLG